MSNIISTSQILMSRFFMELFGSKDSTEKTSEQKTPEKVKNKPLKSKEDKKAGSNDENIEKNDINKPEGFHKIAKGETLYKIANDYGISVSELVEANKQLKNEIRNCMLVRRNDDLMRILPRKEYKAFPLKDKYQEIEFGMLNDNELVINFEFSNNGICNGWWYFSYSLIKMDYKLNINNKIIEKKNIFILPQDNEENNV